MKLEAKLLLCVSADQATVAAWRRRKVVECRRFDNDEPGWTAFSTYLRGARGLPVHIMVDTVDEDFRFETLPHARGSDRIEMIGRKLKQLYRGTPYYSWSLQERATGKRGDDRYLFVALTNPEVLAPWLRAIESNGLPVAGVYPLSIVSASLVERLRLKQTNLLIVTKNSAGFRQTFLKDGKFRISRLTPLRESGGTADQYYADEVANTRMYLDALTVTHVDDTLTAVVVDQDESLGGLPAAIARGRPNIRCHLLTKAEVAARLGISPRDLEASADALHLHLLGEQTPAFNLAPSGVTHGYRRHQATRLVYAASAAVLLGAVLWSGANAYQGLTLGDEIGRLQRETEKQQSQYREVTAQFPQTPTTVENLHNTVEAAQQIRAGLRTPETLFTVVSHALDAAPKVQLNRIEWHYSDAALELESYSDAAAAAATAPPAPVSGTPRQVGIISAEVKPFNGDYRAAIEIINAFAAQLAANDMVGEVRALQLPLNIRSDSGLSGSTATAAASSGAQFRLALRFRPGV